MGTVCYGDYDDPELHFITTYGTAVSWVYYMMYACLFAGVLYEHSLILLAMSGFVLVGTAIDLFLRIVVGSFIYFIYCWESSFSLVYGFYCSSLGLAFCSNVGLHIVT